MTRTIVTSLLETLQALHHDVRMHENSNQSAQLTNLVSQQIITFKPNPIFAPENASDFWNKDVQQAWLNIVPGKNAIPCNFISCAYKQQKDWAMSKLRILHGMTISHSQYTTMSITRCLRRL